MRAKRKSLVGFTTMEAAMRYAQHPHGTHWEMGMPQELRDGSFVVPFWWRDGSYTREHGPRWGSDARPIGRRGIVLAEGVGDVLRAIGFID